MITRLGGIDMAGGGADSTTTTDSGPPQFQLDLLENALTGLSREDFSLSSQFAPDEQSAFNFLRGSVGEGGGAFGTIQGANQAAGNILGEGFLDVAQNPQLMALGDAISGRFAQQFTEGIAPGLRADATIAGQGAGSTKASQAEGLAAGRTASASQNAIAQLMSQAYGQNLAAQTSVLGLSPQLAELNLLPGEVLGEIGGAERELQLFNDSAGIASLMQYLQSIGMNIGGTGTSSTNVDPNFFDRIMSGDIFSNPSNRDAANVLFPSSVGLPSISL